MTLAISEEEQLLLPDPGEKFPIKGHEHEYVVGLDVFHELHCLVCCCIRSIPVKHPRRANLGLEPPSHGVLSAPLQYVHGQARRVS